MIRAVITLAGSAVSVVMVISALWFWHGALRLSAPAARPEIAVWAVRSGAVALAALAQIVLLVCVVAPVYRRDAFSTTLQLFAALTGGVSLVTAVALGLAGR